MSIEKQIEEYAQTKNTVPRNWDDLMFLFKQCRMNLIGRRPKDAEGLKIRLTETAEQGIDNYIREKLLSSQDLEDEFRFVPNEFPYWFTDEIQHWVLWSIRERSDEEINGYLESTINNHFEYCWAKNYRQNQTVKNIFHIHVFIREKSS